MDDDCPPSYEDVINQLQTMEMSTRLNSSLEDFGNRTTERDGQKSYWLFLRVNFTIFDIAISIIALIGYVLMIMTGVFDVTMMNISEFCDDYIFSYNHPNELVGFCFTYISLGTILICICMTSFLSFSWHREEYMTLLMKILRKIWVITVGFLFLCIEVHVLQLAFGVPRPFYFSNNTLYNYYCGNEYTMMSKTLHELDREMRMSFPSFVMSINCFSTAFIIFYLDHFDVGLGPHTAQYVMFLLFGSKCMSDGVRQYNNHEHHFGDILGGAALGIATAAFTVRNLKGTVLRDVNSMPKYVTNGMLFDRLRRISRNFCSSGNTTPDVANQGMVYEYDFPIDYQRNEDPTALVLP